MRIQQLDTPYLDLRAKRRWPLVTLFGVLGVSLASGALAAVTSLGSAGNNTAATSIAITPLAAAVPVGNVVFVSVAADPVAGVTVTCTDSKTNVYTTHVNHAQGATTSGVRTALCASTVAAGKALTTGDTITVTFSSSITAKAISAFHADGLIAVPFDQTAAAGGSSGTANSGNTPTTTQANELLIGAISYEGKVAEYTLPGSGYTALTRVASGNPGASTNHVTTAPQYRIVNATGAYAADATFPTHVWAAGIATFKLKCGNGTVDAGEACDGGSCCTSTCTFEPITTVCRLSEGVCDLDDTCTGASATCPADAKSTDECRPAAGDCDVAEQCDGVGDDCPTDDFEDAGEPCGSGSNTACDNPDTCDGAGECEDNNEPSTTVCRNDAGDCDVEETCDGAGACPADAVAPAGTACGSGSDSVCDDPDTCNASGTCLSNNEATNVVCRNDAGECDVEETCDGAGGCPADGFEPSGTSCGSGSDTVCDDADTCDGSGACDENHEPPTQECRASAGECDVAESCDGAGACPADAFEASGVACGDASDTVCDDADTCNGAGACDENLEPVTTECRAASGDCDVAESCDGNGACPIDAFVSAGTACGDASDTVCDDADTCDGAGACAENNEPTTTECRADAGDCDVAESCDGAGSCPIDLYAVAGTACGNPSDSNCDDADSCDGSGSCDANPEPPTTECRAAVDDCDAAESCDGAGSCPADAFAVAGTACGSPGDTVCDDPDTCDGAGACESNPEPDTTECRADAGDCDVAESCDGAGACPADGFVASGTACGDPSDTVCDDPDTCDGSGACASNLEPVTTECRAPAGDCDAAETCDGAGACPIDAFEVAGTACGDSSDTVCDDADTCDGAGACETNPEPASTPCRVAVGQCDVAETCDGAGSCPADSFVADGTACDDASTCTMDDACEAGACVATPLANGCLDRYLCDRIKTGRFTTVPGVALANAFDTGGFDVQKPRHLCPAVNVDGAGILDAATRLSTFSTRVTDPTPEHTPRTSVVVTNELGEITVDTVKPKLLLEPATIGPVAPNPSSHNVDNYVCYQVKVTRGTDRFPKGEQVSVVDEFTTTAKTLDVKKPTHLCLATDKASNGIKNGDVHLMCYQVKPAKGQPKHIVQQDLGVADGFGSRVVDTQREDILCLPSAVDLP